jgi:hypothetical protein
MSDGISETTPPAGPRLRGLSIAIGALILLVAGVIVGTRLQPVVPSASTAAAPAPEAVAPAKPAPAPTATPATTPGAAPVGELAAAFMAVTGKIDVADTSDKRDGYAEEGTTRPLRLLHVPFGPVLLTSTTNKSTCHACFGAIGVFYLDQQGATFTVRKRWPRAVEGWGWGVPPDWLISEKFTVFPAIYATGTFHGQGLTCNGATLTELTPEGPAEADFIGLSYSNDGLVDPGDPGAAHLQQFEGTIANIVKGKSFVVRATGTATFTEHYVMRGARFVRLEKESRMFC